MLESAQYKCTRYAYSDTCDFKLYPRLCSKWSNELA